MSYAMQRRGRARVHAAHGFGMDVNQAAAAYASAVAEVGGAQADLQMAQSSGDAIQIAIAQAKLTGAQAALDQAKADLAAAQLAAAPPAPPDSGSTPTPTGMPSGPNTPPPTVAAQQASMTTANGKFTGMLPWVLGGLLVLGVVYVAKSGGR